MDDDMKRPLITKKNSSFDKLYEESFIKIQRIKQKNDFLQKQVGVEVEQQMKSEVRKQKQFLEKQIREIKEIMDEIARRFKDPESKNKLKQIKTEAQKQIERNKLILQDLVTKSFLQRSQGSADNQDISHYMADGKAHFQQVDHRRHQNGHHAYEHPKKQSLLTSEHQHHIEQDLEIERKIVQEKNAMLNDIEQSTMKVYDIMNDMGVMVNQQGQNLQMISDNLTTAKKNVEETNQHLQKAQKYQKKSKKKYILFVAMIILLVALVIGIVFIVKGI